MDKNLVLAAVMDAPKGANIVCEWLRPVEVYKGITDKVEKQVRMVGRVGIEYDNIGNVIEKRENGQLPDKNAGIWNGIGEFEIYPYLIRHKKTGQNYLRLYFGTSRPVPFVQWFLNGVLVEKEALKNIATAKEIGKKENDGDCFCVKIESLTRIHHVIEEVEQETEKVADSVAVPVPVAVV